MKNIYIKTLQILSLKKKKEEAGSLNLPLCTNKSEQTVLTPQAETLSQQPPSNLLVVF